MYRTDIYSGWTGAAVDDLSEHEARSQTLVVVLKAWRELVQRVISGVALTFFRLV